MIIDNEKARLFELTSAYIFALSIAGTLLTVSGGYILAYAIIACGTVLPSLHSSLAYRIWSVITTILTLMLLVRDDFGGKDYHRRTIRMVKNGLKSDIECLKSEK